MGSRMTVLGNILEALGNTPLVELRRCFPRGALVAAKVESFNPGSSVKDRIAPALVEAGERSGLLRPGGTIVEPTSGNTGVGLAMVCALKGYKLICTTPDKVPKEKITLLEAYGAEVIVCPYAVPADDPRSYYKVAERIRDEQARIYKQYEELISFGVAKEVARLDTPVSRYSRMRATGNLRGWLGFLTLRMDPRAQFEIRQFAWCVADAIATAFPRTYELFFAGMTPTLDPKSVEDQKKLLSDALDVLNWASGGQAVQGWRDRVDPVRERLRKALGKAV